MMGLQLRRGAVPASLDTGYRVMRREASPR